MNIKTNTLKHLNNLSVLKLQVHSIKKKGDGSKTESEVMGLPSKQLDALCNPSKDWESTSSDVFVTSTLSLFKAVEMNCLPLEQSFQYLWVTKLFKRHMVLKKRLVHEFFVVIDLSNF